MESSITVTWHVNKRGRREEGCDVCALGLTVMSAFVSLRFLEQHLVPWKRLEN